MTLAPSEASLRIGYASRMPWPGKRRRRSRPRKMRSRGSKKRERSSSRGEPGSVVCFRGRLYISSGVLENITAIHVHLFDGKAKGGGMCGRA